MAKKRQVYIDVIVDDKGTVKRMAVDANKLDKALGKTGKTARDTERNTKGVAQASSNGTKNFSKIYSALEMYDVEKLFVEKESLHSRGLTEDDLSVDVKVIDSSEMKKLMSDSEVVLNF